MIRKLALLSTVSLLVLGFSLVPAAVGADDSPTQLAQSLPDPNDDRQGTKKASADGGQLPNTGVPALALFTIGLMMILAGRAVRPRELPATPRFDRFIFQV